MNNIQLHLLLDKMLIHCTLLGYVKVENCWTEYCQGKYLVIELTFFLVYMTVIDMQNNIAYLMQRW